MKWTTNIAQLFTRGRRLFNGGSAAYVGGWSGITKGNFAECLYINCVDLLTNLTQDVSWQFDGSRANVESAFVRFYNSYGKYVMARLFDQGYVVVKHTSEGEGASAWHELSIAQQSDYRKAEENGWTVFSSTNPDKWEIGVLRTSTYLTTGKSDKMILAPFLEYLDNTLNASNTVSARMGAMVVCSPKNPTNSPMSVTLDEEEKKAIEEQMSKEYGALSNQHQVMVLPREMQWQVISLATLDMKVTEKVKMAICAITDRFGLPANQVAIIDANSSKSLSNGTELREGDLNKYKSFERYLDQTFVQFAREMGLKPGARESVQGEVVGSYYTIYNKPTQTPAAV